MMSEPFVVRDEMTVRLADKDARIHVLKQRLESQNKILTVKANRVQELEDELVAQAVSRDTYYREWEERAKKQQMLIESLRNKVNEMAELRQKLEDQL